MFPKISCVQTTYGRFQCVERSMNMFLSQDYQGEKELIIFNTDVEHPYYDQEELRASNIFVYNCNTDYITSQPYTNVGAIRRDALTHATGDYVVTWDDDDVFLPFFLSQGMYKIQTTGLPSFKPEQSFFYNGGWLRTVMNTMEASIVADITKVREYGYLLETGKEGLGWYTKMRDNRELNEHDPIYIPSYCFNWNDGDKLAAPHKQSGDINNPNNFENHKYASRDYCMGKMRKYTEEEMRNIYHPYFAYLSEHIKEYDEQLVTVLNIKELKDKFLNQ